jgi:hypothetical protein
MLIDLFNTQHLTGKHCKFLKVLQQVPALKYNMGYRGTLADHHMANEAKQLLHTPLLGSP